MLTRLVVVLSGSLLASSALAQATPAAASPATAPHFDATPGWALVVTGAVLALGGLAVLSWGEIDRSSVQNAPVGSTWASISDAYQRTPILEAVGVGSLLAAVAFAGVGLFRALIVPPTSRSPSLALVPGALLLTGHF